MTYSTNLRVPVANPVKLIFWYSTDPVVSGSQSVLITLPKIHRH